MALTFYVDTLTTYSTDDSSREDKKKEKKGEACDNDTLQLLRGCDAEVLVALDSLGCLPLQSPVHSLPAEVRRHHGYASTFKRLGDVLERELEAAGDHSLSSSNRYVLETVNQVKNIEMTELGDALKAIPSIPSSSLVPFSFVPTPAPCPPTSSSSLSSSSSSSSPSPSPSSSSFSPSSSSSPSPSLDGGEISIPRGFICPISLEVMTDPVIAADGHCYERSMIEVFIFFFIFILLLFFFLLVFFFLCCYFSHFFFF